MKTGKHSIVYGQQVQINYRSIFSGVKSITRIRNFHIFKHVEANTFAAIRLDCSLDTFYYTWPHRGLSH